VATKKTNYFHMKISSIIFAILIAAFSCLAQQSAEMEAYILTPKPAETPRFNGAKVVGVGLGSPFLFRIPATGIRPITFSAKNLPQGLMLDKQTGIISGKIKKAGEYLVKQKAENSRGKATRVLKIVV
jgi:alpha-galactosidase